MSEICEIVLYGSGIRCERVCRLLKESGIDVRCIVDSNPEKWGGFLDEYKIVSPDIFSELRTLPLCITIADRDSAKTIRHTLKNKYSYELENEIGYHKLFFTACQKIREKNISLKKPEWNKASEKNIIFDCIAGLGLGGIEAWTRDICRELLLHGHSNMRILSGKEPPDLEKELQDIIDYEEIENKLDIDSIEKLMNYFYQYIPCKIVTGKVNAVLHAACLLKWMYPEMVEIISVIHAGYEENYKDYIDFENFIDTYIGVSEDIVQAMRQKGAKRVYHMTCPVSCKKILERSYTVDSKQPVRIGYAGRIEKVQKRMDLLIELIKRLELRQIHYVMDIAGKGRYETEIINYIKDYHLENKIFMIGEKERKEMPDFWLNHDICVNIADFEGRSITIMESMANGVVPVVTATSGVCEDIKDGENGYIIELRNYAAMAERIAYLEQNRELLPVMGQKAHAVIYPKVQMEDHIRFWERILYSDEGRKQEYLR